MMKYRHFKGTEYQAVANCVVTTQARESRTGDVLELSNNDNLIVPVGTNRDMYQMYLKEYSNIVGSTSVWVTGIRYRGVVNATDKWSCKYAMLYGQFDEDGNPITLYYRDRDEFNSPVDTKKYPYVEQKYRFQLIENSRCSRKFNFSVKVMIMYVLISIVAVVLVTILLSLLG